MQPDITFLCGHCGQELTTPWETVGISGPCPTCGESITVPDPATNPGPSEVPAAGQQQFALPAFEDAIAGAETIRPGPSEWPPRPASSPVPSPELQAAAMLPPASRVGPIVQYGDDGLPLKTGGGWMKSAALVAVGAGVAVGAWQWFQSGKTPDAPPPVSPPAVGVQTSVQVPAAPDPAPSPPPVSPPPAEPPAAPVVAGAEPILPAPEEATIPAALPPVDPDTPPVAVPIPETVAETPPEPDPPGTFGVDTTTPLAPALKTEAAGVRPSLLGAPRAAIENFLTAPTWKERLPYVLQAERLGPAMEAYYSTWPDGPVPVNSLDYLMDHEVPGTKFRFYVFQLVTGRNEAGIPMSVEETADGFRVDWTSFVEAKDAHLQRFCENPSAEAGNFRLVLRRGHYYGDDVPDQNGKTCYDITGPVPGETWKAWADNSSVVYQKELQGERASWDAVSYPILKLEWVKGTGDVRWIRIADFISESWRLDDAKPGAR